MMKSLRIPFRWREVREALKGDQYWLRGDPYWWFVLGVTALLIGMALVSVGMVVSQALGLS